MTSAPSDRDKETSGSQTDEVFTTQDPFALFDEWMQLAQKKELNDANAVAVATVDAAGMPDVRMVLLKEASPAGFVFYTNLESAKGEELLGQPKAAFCFHWKSLRRQIRLRGVIRQVSDEEADAYFQSRAKDSQIGAWASRQSRPLESRFELEKEVARYAAKYALRKVERPPYWSGFRLEPLSIEFWRDRPFRLHDRLVFKREQIDASWTTSRLFP